MFDSDIKGSQNDFILVYANITFNCNDSFNSKVLLHDCCIIRLKHWKQNQEIAVECANPYPILVGWIDFGGLSWIVNNLFG